MGSISNNLNKLIRNNGDSETIDVSWINGFVDTIESTATNNYKPDDQSKTLEKYTLSSVVYNPDDTSFSGVYTWNSAYEEGSKPKDIIVDNIYNEVDIFVDDGDKGNSEQIQDIQTLFSQHLWSFVENNGTITFFEAAGSVEESTDGSETDITQKNLVIKG